MKAAEPLPCPLASVAPRGQTIPGEGRPLARGKRTAGRILALYQSLAAGFGPRHWWPGDTPFEIMVGAVLTQNTAWRNVEKAIANLKAAGLMCPAAMLAAEREVLAAALKPSGYYNLKTERLLGLVRLVAEHGGGGERPAILGWPLDRLRPALLSVKGIGPETADSIALYAGQKPSFVIDLYTRRVLARHGLAKGDEPYEELRAWFMEHLPPDEAMFNEFHALFVAVGHHFCGPTARCGPRPL